MAVPACGRLEAALVLIAEHFISVWRGSMRRRRRARERVLGRKDGLCQVPGCTRAAVHSHHIRYRSHGGGEEETNRLALCAAHHLHCLHRGWMRVHKTSDGRLAWELGVCADSVREVRYTAAA